MLPALDDSLRGSQCKYEAVGLRRRRELILVGRKSPEFTNFK